MLCTTAPLKAAGFTVQNGITLTNQNVTLSNGDTGTILQGGTIQDIATNATGNVTVDNTGTVVTTSGGDDGVEGDVLTLTN